jgi:ElaB/YqjD/DUF883 family membrane-anchored ribosome-binding protein
MTMMDTSTMTDRAEATAERMGDVANGAIRSAEQAFDSRRKGTADKFASAAERLHRRADDLPGVERAAKMAHGTADRLEATAEYLRTHDAKAMAGNVMDVVRKHPGKSLAIAVVIGFLAARSLRSD